MTIAVTTLTFPRSNETSSPKRIARAEIIEKKPMMFISVTGSSNKTRMVTSAPAAEDEFEVQKQAFQRIPASTLARYSGKWVVSRDGQIVDSDFDLQLLSRRYFDANGDVDVYIVKA